MEKIRILKGTTIKAKIEWSYPSSQSVTLDTINFDVEFKAQGKVKMKKDQLYHDEDGWFAYIDSASLGTGIVYIRLRAEIPDANAPHGYKVDISEAETDLYIYG